MIVKRSVLRQLIPLKMNLNMRLMSLKSMCSEYLSVYNALQGH